MSSKFGPTSRRPGVRSFHRAAHSSVDEQANQKGAQLDLQPPGHEAPRPIKNFFLSSAARLKVEDKRKKQDTSEQPISSKDSKLVDKKVLGLQVRGQTKG